MKRNKVILSKEEIQVTFQKSMDLLISDILNGNSVQTLLTSPFLSNNLKILVYKSMTLSVVLNVVKYCFFAG